LQDQLDDWEQWLKDKKRTWNEFWQWIRDNPTGGPIPGETAGTSTAGVGIGVKNPGGSFIKPMAAGGSVMTGGRYLVGEYGPELFSPTRSGFIIPPGTGGGGDIVIHHQTILDGRVIEETVRRQTYRYQARNGTSGYR